MNKPKQTNKESRKRYNTKYGIGVQGRWQKKW